MKKKSKILWGIITLVMMTFMLLRVVNSNERQTTSFVVDNEEELEKVSLAYLQGNPFDASYKSSEIDGVFGGEHTIVQFLYSAFGIAPASKYYGFYYSPDDVPVAFQNMTIPLIQTNTNEWEWSDGTDNGGITKRIYANWFYYEAWF